MARAIGSTRMRSRLSSVRVRTTAFATLVVTVALVLGGGLLLVVQQHALVSGLERSARSRATDVTVLAQRRALPPTLTAAREDAAFTQVVDTRGAVVAASENLDGELPVLATIPKPGASLVTKTVASLDGRFRIAVRRVETATGPVVVYAGDNLSAVDDATRQLATLLAIGLPILVGLVGLMTWWVTGRALRPVEAIRAEVTSIGESELHRRVPEPAARDEVGRLARTMNAMLARLDLAADRQRRFVSDASHELQSPLTSLRARLEVNLRSKVDPDWRANERDSLDEVIEMQRLVDDLLTLARIDSRTPLRRRVPVDLDEIALREAERLRARGRVDVDVHQVGAGQVLGDPDQLTRALRNVLDNAERYARREVVVALASSTEGVVLDVRDDGVGVPVEDRSRIFERFARVDDARTRGGASTGLGLAITRAIVRDHGGEVTVEDAETGARFVVRLPAALTS